MARPKKKQKKERTPVFDDLSPHAKQSIAALFVGSFGVFLVLSLLEYAGMVGSWTDVALTKLFGAGAWLAPLTCGFFVYAFLNPREDNRVSMSKLFGIVLALLSLLGLFELYQVGAGGWMGLVLEWPLKYLMNGAAAGVFLVAFTVTGFLLTFNAGIGLPAFLRSLFSPKPLPEEEVDEEDFYEAPFTDTIEGPEEMVMEEAEAVPSPEKKPMSERLGLKKNSDDFTVTAFTGKYAAPPLNLLSKDKGKPKTGDVKANSNTIKRVLKEFGISVEMDGVEIGPTVTRFALKPAQGVKISRIVGLQRELELNLALSENSIRIEAPIPGKSLVGIEVPNIEKQSIGLASMLTTPDFTDSPKPLLAALGKDITGKPHFANIARMPHGLIAGTTGSGKSVAIHNLIVSLLFRNSPEQLRLIMVDPKRVELTLYDGIPHLLSPVITDARKVLKSLNWAVKEMERRYDILQAEKVQNLETYHNNIYFPAKKAWETAGSLEEDKSMVPEPLPYVVIVMDELADLMHSFPRELEALIVRLAQMSRAVGIHLLLATQRPSVNVITGTIKANIPTRIALQVSSQIDSRTILDQPGAEKLLGKGDMLFLTGEIAKPIRLQSAFVSVDEIKNVVEYLKKQSDAHELDQIDLENTPSTPDGIYAGNLGGDDEDDELYLQAKQIVLTDKKASTSYLQRKLRIGYSRAARLIDVLEENGVIGPADGAKPRAVLEAGTESDEPEDSDDDYRHERM
jgi:DNA segregation ATPase FtsK/SpoIIIE, S-DNA-T family